MTGDISTDVTGLHTVVLDHAREFVDVQKALVITCQLWKGSLRGHKQTGPTPRLSAPGLLLGLTGDQMGEYSANSAAKDATTSNILNRNLLSLDISTSMSWLIGPAATFPVAP